MAEIILNLAFPSLVFFRCVGPLLHPQATVLGMLAWNNRIYSSAHLEAPDWGTELIKTNMAFLYRKSIMYNWCNAEIFFVFMLTFFSLR